MAPMSPLNSPIFFSVFTSIVKGSSPQAYVYCSEWSSVFVLFFTSRESKIATCHSCKPWSVQGLPEIRKKVLKKNTSCSKKTVFPKSVVFHSFHVELKSFKRMEDIFLSSKYILYFH
jgi:hypothetical protein